MSRGQGSREGVRTNGRHESVSCTDLALNQMVFLGDLAASPSLRFKVRMRALGQALVA